MSKKIRFFCGIAVLAGLLSSCATSNDPADLYKGESDREIFTRGKSDLQERSFSEAVKRFEALDVQYPYGPYTETGQLYLIYGYYMKEDYILASSAADRFIRIHPDDANVDYAYYMRGVANYYQNMGLLERMFIVDLATRDLTQIQKSYNDFNELTTRFPNSRYTPSAHQYMVFLRNVMAKHELQIAKYYYNRQAYIASANRASDLVAHYQGAPTVPEGLEVMAKSYRKLRLTKLEEDTVAVYQYNYPGAKIDWDAKYKL